ncbi:LysR family transcriptional regulator [Aquimarina aquimarini]|uniref:LysR family transcriptional regulator n=1 Tax=Aquimarina aquimarini TaxID=1191734 RepID=UPI000D5629AA|nr:LysR family transcriptional regulator [Aquimarina aquimarini]
MEIKYFRLIKTIVDQGNIVNSSKKLFLTQSALSHQLKGLEELLGFKVFYRTRGNWKLTEQGIEFYNLSSKVLKTIDEGFIDIQKIASGSKGHIRITPECFSFYQGIPGFIQKMGILYPEIKIDLIVEATSTPIPRLHTNEIDIAIVTKRPFDDSLKSIPIFDDEIFAIMHKENKCSAYPYIEPTHFLENHLIIHSYPLETVSVYTHYLKPNNIIPKKISAIPLTEVALEMVCANMGIMTMPKWALKSFKLSEEITLKKIGNQGLKRTHYLVIRKTDESKKYINDFISNFKENSITS